MTDGMKWGLIGGGAAVALYATSKTDTTAVANNAIDDLIKAGFVLAWIFGLVVALEVL